MKLHKETWIYSVLLYLLASGSERHIHVAAALSKCLPVLFLCLGHNFHLTYWTKIKYHHLTDINLKVMYNIYKGNPQGHIWGHASLGSYVNPSHLFIHYYCSFSLAMVYVIYLYTYVHHVIFLFLKCFIIRKRVTNGTHV